MAEMVDVPARARQRAVAAVKVAMPLDAAELAAFDRSLLVHELAAGRGCAEHPGRVLAAGRSRRRAGDRCRAPPTAGRRDRGDVGALQRPCPRELIDRALACCDDRAAAFDPARAVLVHGDAHGWNTLGAVGGFQLVDPEGVRSEPAHDLGVPMGEYNEPLIAGNTSQLVRQRAEQLAAWCDIDPHAVWQWDFIERVSTGLLNVRDFESDDGALFLEVAARSR